MASTGTATTDVRTIPWSAIVAIGVGLFGLGLAVGGYGAYVSLLMARGISPDAAGLGMSLFLLGQFLVVVPADRLTRTVAVERVAATGLATAGVGIVIGGFLALSATYVSRLLLGLGQGVAFVAGMKYVGLRTASGDTATAQGMLGALFTLGLAVGLAAGPTAVGTFGLAVPAAVAAAIAIAGGALASRLAPVSDPGDATLRAYLYPFTSTSGLALGLGNMATFGFLMVASTWYVEVLASAGLPGTTVLVAFALATVAGRGLGGWLSRAFGERSTVAVTTLGLGIVLFGLAVAIEIGSTPGIAIGLVLTGFGFGIPFGPLFSLAFSELADDPGVTLSGMLLVGNGAALVFPWLVGWMLDSTESYAGGFVALGLAVGVTWVVWMRTIGR